MTTPVASYSPRRTADDDLVNQNFDAIKRALDSLTAQGADSEAEIASLLSSVSALIGGGGTGWIAWIANLLNATAGNESTNLVTQAMYNGVPVPGLDIRGNATLFPVLGITASLAQPSIGFQANPGIGFFLDIQNQLLGEAVNGLYVASQSATAKHLISDNGEFAIGSINQTGFGASPGTLNARIRCDYGDVQAGADGALAAAVTAGFFDVPAIAGPPTAAPTRIATGHQAEVADTTSGVGKRWISPETGAHAGGRWACLNRGGKGTAVTTGATLTIAPFERAAFDYFHLTSGTAVDFIQFSATDVYAPIGDGEAITFYCDVNRTFNNNTAAPPANAYPLQINGGANVALLAGAKIQFRRDDTQAKWVEMWRSGP